MGYFLEIQRNLRRSPILSRNLQKKPEKTTEKSPQPTRVSQEPTINQ
jgi:hypothetical protein